MDVIFAPGEIMRTDYFGSDDCYAGLAWLAVRGREWHVLLPKHCGALPEVAYARPVTDHEEPHGWRWRLEIGTCHLPIKHRQIFGPPPDLPAPGSKADCVVFLYLRRENHAHRHENRRTPVIPRLVTRLPLMVVRARREAKRMSAPQHIPST